MKKIQDLKKEKETLAMNYEQEEEFLTNDLSRKLMQVLLSLFCKSRTEESGPMTTRSVWLDRAKVVTTSMTSKNTEMCCLEFPIVLMELYL